MTPPNLKSWQWVAIGLVLGLALGFLRQFANDLGVADYGETINGYVDFERALVQDVRLADGSTVRGFGRLTVYPERLVGDNGTRPVYVVAGSYIGRPKVNAASGLTEASVEPRCFVADAGPYRPRGSGQEFPSVMAYLDSLRPEGVTYMYAWWHDGRWTIPLWAGVGVVCVGVVLPGLLNLLAYGSLRAPREEPDAAEAGAPVKTLEPAALPADHGGEEEEVEAYNAGLEGQVDPGPAPPAPPAPTAPQVKPLRAGPVEAAAPHAAEPDKLFGTRDDDFYPTERHPGAGPKA